jgi:hypothetical protein
MALVPGEQDVEADAAGGHPDEQFALESLAP